MTKLLASGGVIRLKLRDFFSSGAASNLKCKNHVQQTCLCRLSTHFVFPNHFQSEHGKLNQNIIAVLGLPFLLLALPRRFVRMVPERLDVIVFVLIQLGIKFCNCHLFCFNFLFVAKDLFIERSKYWHLKRHLQTVNMDVSVCTHACSRLFVGIRIFISG